MRIVSQDLSVCLLQVGGITTVLPRLLDALEVDLLAICQDVAGEF